MRDEYHSLASLRRVSMALASKACRSAVMIGESLSHAQMKTIVSNLAHMRKPWVRSCSWKRASSHPAFIGVDLRPWKAHCAPPVHKLRAPGR